MFLESLINGFATALAYLIVFAMMLLVSWRLGPRLYMRMMQSVTRDFMTTMMGTPSTGPPPPHRVCSACGYGLASEHRYCAICGVECTVASIT